MLVVGGRLLVLQGFDGTAYAAAGEASRLKKDIVQAPRGSIVDATGKPLAYSVETRRVVADPTLIAAADRPAVADLLANQLGIPYRRRCRR